jgi:cell division protein FtsZ
MTLNNESNTVPMTLNHGLERGYEGSHAEGQSSFSSMADNPNPFGNSSLYLAQNSSLKGLPGEDSRSGDIVPGSVAKLR